MCIFLIPTLYLTYNIMVFYLGSFTLYNLAYMVRAWVKVAARGRRQRLRLAEFAERGAAQEDKRGEREGATVAGPRHWVLRGHTASMLTHATSPSQPSATSYTVFALNKTPPPNQEVSAKIPERHRLMGVVIGGTFSFSR